MYDNESTPEYAQTADCGVCQTTIKIVSDAGEWRTQCGHRTWRRRPRHTSRPPRTSR